jgi:hypothetical protein
LYQLQFQGGLTSGRLVVKTIAESLSEHDETMLYPLNGIWVRQRRHDILLCAGLTQLNEYPEQVELLKKIWFTKYARHWTGLCKCSCAFENIFMAELKSDEVLGKENFNTKILQKINSTLIINSRRHIAQRGLKFTLCL